MKSIPKKAVLSLSLLMCCSLLCDYNIADLRNINEKTDFLEKKAIITGVIKPENLEKIDPQVIANILDNDTQHLHFTRLIVHNIDHKNFNNLRPITIRHLVQKGGNETSAHIISVFKESPALFMSTKPELLNMFLQTAGSDYALALAKLIKPDLLLKINPAVIELLIEAHIEAAKHIIQLINKDNLTMIDPTIKMALQKSSASDVYKEHLKKIMVQVKQEAPKQEAPKRKPTILEQAKNLLNSNNYKNN